VGVRLSPFGVANDSGGGDAPLLLYTHAVEALADFGLAYLHLIEPRASGLGLKDVSRPEMPSSLDGFGTLLAVWSRAALP
jgi:N-ethylmaleimide reductase